MVDYLILTFIREEHEAVWQLFRDSTEKIVSDIAGSPRVVAVRTRNGKSVSVAIARTASEGNLSGQGSALQLIDELKPKLVITVGISGAVPTSDVCLGDVVLGNEVHDLTRGAETASGREHAARSSYLTSAVRDFVANVTNSDFKELQERASSIPRPEVRDIGTSWTDDDSWNLKIDSALEQTKDRSLPSVVDGVIACSDDLVKSRQFMENRLSVDRHILINDMESAGVAMACERRGVPLLILRSVSDIIEHTKTDDWKLYACEVVAICALDVIHLGAVDTIRNKLPGGESGISDTTRDAIERLRVSLSRIRRKVTSNYAVLCRDAFKLFTALPDELKRKWAPELFDTLDKPMKYLGDKKLVLEVAKACIDCCSGTDLDDDAAKCKARALICGTSWSYQRTGQLGLAEEDAKDSVRISKGIRDHRNLAFCKKCLGRLQRMRAEAASNSALRREFLNESTGCLREAIELFTNLCGSDDPEVGDCYSLLGRTYLVTGDVDRARECVNEARFRIDTDSKDFLDLLILEGDIHLVRAEYSKALDCYQTAIESVPEEGYQISEILARAHRQRGDALTRSGRSAEAESAYFEAQRIWEHYEEDNLAAEAEWGGILASKKLHRRAIRLLEAEEFVVRCLAVRLYYEKQSRRSRLVVAQRVGADDTVWKNLIREAKQQIALGSDSN